MRLKANEVIKRITNIWGHLKQGGIALPDEKYWIPSTGDIQKFLNESHYERLKWTKEMFDCDDFALLFHSFIVRKRYQMLQESKLSKKERLPWSIGQSWLTKVNGKNWNHAINIALTRDNDVIFIEPQSDEIWKADANKDHPVFIRM